MPLDTRLVVLTGLGLRDTLATPAGPVDPLRDAARLPDDCRAMLTPLVREGASISRPARPRDVAFAPAKASTASSKTAGTV